MRSIIETLKNRQILTQALLMLVLQLFVGLSIVYVLVTDESIYVQGSSDQTSGIFIAGISLVFGLIFSIITFFLSISRIRTLLISIILALPLISIIILGLIPGVNSLMMASDYIGPIILVSFYLSYLYFGFTTFVYFRIKNSLISIGNLTFWHFGVIMLSISNEISYSITGVDTVLENLPKIFNIETIVMACMYLFLASIFVINDQKIELSRWKKNQRGESKIGWRNYIFGGSFAILAVILTMIISPLFWRLYWEEVGRQEEYIQEQLEQQQTQEGQSQKPQLYDRNQSPQNENGQINPGDKLTTQVPIGEGIPVFTVRLGEEDATGAENLFVKSVEADGEKISDEVLYKMNVYDSYVGASGFTRQPRFNNSEYSLNKTQKYYYSGYEHKYESSAIQEQRFVNISLETKYIPSMNRVIEVVYESDFNKPYLYGLQSDVVLTGDNQYLVPNGRYFSRSEVIDVNEVFLDDTAINARVGFTDNELSPLYFFIPGAEVNQLAEDITTETQSDYDKVSAVEKYLQDNYEVEYFTNTGTNTLEKFKDNQDEDLLTNSDIKEFLITKDPATLNYHNFAMVMLLDSLNIDARVVSGFYQGEYDETIEGYVVYDTDFSYWVEVYFSGIGWVPFHPAGEPEEIVQDRLEALRLDALPDLDQKQQQDIIDEYKDQEWFDGDINDLRDQWQDGNNNFDEFDIPEDFDWEKYWEEYYNNEEFDFPTPTPIPEPDVDQNNNLEELFNSIGEQVARTWWMFCCCLIFIVVFTPPVAKLIKFNWRKGTFSKRSDKDQIKQNFELLQDILADFGQELKLPETAYKFVERFIDEFPLENKDDIYKELYTFATIYNRSIFADKVKPDDNEVMQSLIFQIADTYLQTKGIKQYLRWYNPRGTLRR